MKCPRCGNNQKYRDGTRCSQCSYIFILSKYDGIQDFRMQKAVGKTSIDNTVYFTPNQLYATCYRKEPLLAQVSLFVVLPLFLLLTLSLLYTWWLVLPIILLVWWWAFRNDYKERLQSRISEDSLNKAFKKWAERRHINLPKDSRGEPLKLIDAPKLKQAPKASAEKDLYDYGVEAVIVTDQDIYVDLFVKNGYHTQYKALIISKNLYPKYLKPHLTRLLQEKPDLPLFFIHDATDVGQKTMAHFKKIDGLAVEVRCSPMVGRQKFEILEYGKLNHNFTILIFENRLVLGFCS